MRIVWAAVAVACSLLAGTGPAQPPCATEIAAGPLPAVDYTLRVDPTDTTGFTVTMRVCNAPDSFRVAMVAHPEYDDHYWRYVRDLHVSAPSGPAAITLADSALWRVSAPGGDVTIAYRLALPPTIGRMRTAYRPFVFPTGALVGAVYSFMYVVGHTDAPARVRLDIPPSWDIATGLEPTTDRHVFTAASTRDLVESPILLGALRNWTFTVDGVPHRVAYLPAPGAVPFDTARFVDGVRRIARQAIALFGHAPYRHYTFLIEDGAYGSLEHPNSVTLGIPSADLARDPTEYFEEIAHEYFHAWNGMRIHSVAFGDVSYRTLPRSSGLWWTEGATMFYADLLTRRAGQPTEDSTRLSHVARLLGNYYSTSGNRLLSPERVSRAEYGLQADQLGDNSASTHLQGELITTALDLTIRDHTQNRRSIDDVMRGMMTDYSGARGFTTDDVAREVERVCGCATTAFFADHVHGSAPLDFNRYLALIGLTSRVTWAPATGDDGSPQPDLRVYGWQPRAGAPVKLMVLDTASVWERAGLHTGDDVVAIDERPVPDLAALRTGLRSRRIGDSVRVTVHRPDGVHAALVRVTGYERATVTIVERADATPAQRALRDAWLQRPGHDWARFGWDATRTSSPAADMGVSAANVVTLVRQQVHLDGTVDASPIYLHGVQVGGAAHDVFFVTTTYGKTIAVDADRGTILWEYTPSSYASVAGSSQITNATPVADPDRAHLYAASPDGYVQKLAVSDGRVVWRTAVTRLARREKIASSLNFFNGRVVAVTGGYIGDAPPYQGHVAILDGATGRLLHVWNALCSGQHELIDPASCPESDAAIWGRAGAVIDSTTGNILVATGNATWDGRVHWGDAVVELDADATRIVGNYTPQNTAELNADDADLGSSSPVLLDGGLVAQGGKDSKIRILEWAAMHGIAPHRGGEASSVPTPSGDRLFTAPAVLHDGATTWLIAADNGGTSAWTVVGKELKLAWHTGYGGTSPVVADGLAFAYDPRGGLRVYAATTGRQIATLDAGSGHWNSPIVVDGRIALPEGDANAHRTDGILDIWRPR